MQNGGEIIAEYLAREKVPYVFGICGHGNIGLLDALYDRADTIKTISTRHALSEAGAELTRFARETRIPVVFSPNGPVLSGFTDESKVGGNKVKGRLYDLLVTKEELLGFPAYEYLGTGPIEVDGVEIPDVLMAGQLIIDAKFKAYGTFFSDEFGVGVTRGKLRLPSDSTVPVAKFKAEADRKIKIKASLDKAVSPRISVDPKSTVDYGSINIGSTVTLTFTVKNVGRGTLVGGVTVASPFEIVSGSPYSIPKDGEATVEVRFSPTVTGSFSEALIFTGGGGATRTVTGTASDVGAVLSVDPAGELDFGTVSLIVFSSVDLSFTATNIGTGTLVGKVTLGQAGVFRLVNNNQIVGSIDYALAANQSTTIMVRFTPVSVGVVTDKVTFTGGGGAMREVRGVGGS